MREKTYKTAMGGVMSAFAIVTMFIGSVLPFATYASPAFASLCVLYFCLEFGKGTAFIIYAAVSGLSLLIVPDKEQAFLFVFFFGFYPIVKAAAEKKLSNIPCWLVKLLVFNVCIIGLYYLIVNIFIVEAVRQEFAEYTRFMVLGLLAGGNAAFIVYDIALTKLSVLYFVKLKPKLIKNR